jgi:hypothetical protein
MPAIPQIPKVILFTLDLGADPEDFSLDVLDVGIVPTPGAIQSVRTLDGTKHQDAEAETWSLVIRCVLDWDSARPGMAYWLNANKGSTATAKYRVVDGAISASNPEASATVTLVPIPFGGPGQRFVEATVTMPIDGDPAYDHTP